MYSEIDYFQFDYYKLLDFLRENDLLESTKINKRNCLLIRLIFSDPIYSDDHFDFSYYELEMHPSNLRYAIDKMRILSSDINKGIYNLDSFSGPVFIEIYSYTLKPDGKVSKLLYKTLSCSICPLASIVKAFVSIVLSSKIFNLICNSLVSSQILH